MNRLIFSFKTQFKFRSRRIEEDWSRYQYKTKRDLDTITLKAG